MNIPVVVAPYSKNVAPMRHLFMNHKGSIMNNYCQTSMQLICMDWELRVKPKLEVQVHRGNKIENENRQTL
jgi:hypothetical protein